MAYIPWTLYAMRLQRVAQKMASAQDSAALEHCLQEHSALWERIAGLITEAEEEGVTGLRRQILPLTRLVNLGRGDAVRADGTGESAAVESLSTLIALNRQAAAMLPDLELGTPVRQWLN
ncbi:hypothetical protein [Novispirillum itersonii]|uniref:hypothetical protein n=1 Tax=Novispirillum itersonii TaxID=189 RepID=UPI0003614BBF|nr:hypothetical protein [Novispirillum itersonii]